MPSSQGHVVADDGARLFFQRAGRGDPVLLVLNGFYLFEDFSYLAESRTVIGLDLRNRGRSELLVDAARLSRGVQQDADDIEAVRRHFAIEAMDILAHSYAGSIPILYALRHPSRVRRIIQLGPMPPDPTTQYPAHLRNQDDALQEFVAGLAELRERRQDLSPVDYCREFWALLRPIYVFDRTDAAKIQHWEGCDLATERGFMRYWTEYLLPSIERLVFTEEEVTPVTTPVLVIHGTKDRSSAYGGGRDWALRLPNARLLTVEDAAHAPWVEAPGEVLGPVRRFLDGEWPAALPRP
jgi:pimeloyl-ACP methyl ester carboxylesterase